MRDFCVAFSFAATFASAIVLLSVALWNEGCNQSVNPSTVSYSGSYVVSRNKQEPEIMPLNSGTVERPALLILPPSLSPEPKP